MPSIAYLECSRCRNHVSADSPQSVCPACAGSLFVRYEPDALAHAQRPACDAQQSMWRYAGVLPDAAPVTLGEGWTPMLPSRRFPAVYLKEEAGNPTGSCKARGISMAVTMARHYGLKKLAALSSGNAASALAAYAAAASMEAHIFMPRNVPMANHPEVAASGASVTLVDGLLSDCRCLVAERSEREGWFDVSSLQEPFRVEGEKTMSYEFVEQLGWQYPDAVFYPAGEGVGLIGMWKAFEEMEQPGWVSGQRPRMIAVQVSGDAPVGRAGKEGAPELKTVENASTLGAGLRFRGPDDESLIVDIVRASGGTIVDVSDEQILNSLLDWSHHEGLFLCPEGAAAAAAYEHLLASGFLSARDRVVLFNTSSGLRYADAIAEAMHLTRPAAKPYPTRTPVGGIITPQ